MADREESEPAEGANDLPDDGRDDKKQDEEKQEAGLSGRSDRDEKLYVVITGVSSGIGFGAAKKLIACGYDVFGSVRSKEDAARVQEELGPYFTPLIFDVTDTVAIQKAVDRVSEAVGDDTLYGLVNNAGIAVGGPLMHIPLEDVRRQLEVNVIGLLAVTQAFLPLLGARKDAPPTRGRIVNISSVSGHTAYPFLGPYAASKHAVEALSDSLRRELLLYDIDVIVIVPGAVDTPLWEKAQEIDAAKYEGTDYYEYATRMQATMADVGREGMDVERVSETIREALESDKPRTRYVLTNSWLMGWIVPRWMPDRWFDREVGKQLGLTEVD